MVVSFYINHLNHHQSPVADEMFKLLGCSFHFIETCSPTDSSKKGSEEDYSKRKYLICAWNNQADRDEALRLAVESDIALFGAGSFSYQVYRAKNTNKVSFEVSERWLKRGIFSLLSPRLWKYQWYYHTLFYKKPLYKLCASGFAASDQRKMLSFKDRCFKWGYFPYYRSVESIEEKRKEGLDIRIMWCSRFLKLKHPELPVLLAEKFKKKGVHLIIDMFGDGPEFQNTAALIHQKKLSECVFLHGNKPNTIITEQMRNHSIFLFTSDRHEGWGVVANESMANGCLLVSSNEIGSTPYLIKPRITGCVFKSKRLSSLVNEVTWILSHPKEAQAIREAGMQYIMDYWNPKNAAQSLIKLSESLLQGRPAPMVEGPCSLA